MICLFNELIVVFKIGSQYEAVTLGRVDADQTEPRWSPVDGEMLLDVIAMLLRLLPTVRADDLIVILSSSGVEADGVKIKRRMTLATVACFFALCRCKPKDELAFPYLQLLKFHISIQY